MRTHTSLAAGTVAVLSLLVPACGGGGGSAGGGSGGPQGGTLRVRIADAPFPFSFVESAKVTIDEVRVHERNSDAWTTVFTGSKTIDLVPLHDGVSALLVESAVPPGTYDMVRLIVGGGEVDLTADAFVQGSSHTFTTADGSLFFPSGAQTGIKIGIENDIVVTTRLSGDLILDFDLARNFVFNGPVTHAPGVRRVIFTPSVRATNASVAGSVTLRVLSDSLTPIDPSDDVPIAGAMVSVFPSSADPATATPTTTASTDAAGVATISLAPGTWTLVVEATGHESTTIHDVVVVLANLTDLGDVTLVATGTISGVVMSDAATPAATADDVVVAGVTVDVFVSGTTTLAGTATTGASGDFQVSGLAAGNYDLAFHATGFDDLTVNGVATTLGGAGATYILHARTANVAGTVTDTATATGIGGVSISVVNLAGVVVATTTTAADGTYSTSLATGTYQVTFTNGAAVQTAPLTVVGASPPPTVTLDVSF